MDMQDLSTTERRKLVASVVARNEVATQDELIALLAAEGVRITQATLSRDLRDTGVRKRGGHYCLAPEGGLPQVQQRRFLNRLADSVVDAQATGPMTVLRTRPGMAQAVALELAGAGLPDILGTIAGVDTVFVAAVSPSRARTLGHRLSRGAGKSQA